MKYALAALIVCSSTGLLAQKNNLYADVGSSPGFSVTYNRQIIKRLSLGAGFQGYDFSPTETNVNQFTPAIYGDLRLNSLQRKKHFFFYFLDMGVNIYKHNNNYTRSGDYVSRDNGTYAGLGFGYFRRITKRGSGLYASLKLISNIFRDNEYNATTNKYRRAMFFYGDGVLSVGFKF